MAPELGHSPFGLDCRCICRIVDASAGEFKLFAGTAVLVSDQGKEFGYALTCWHNFDFYHKLPDFEGIRELQKIWLLPRWANVEDKKNRKPVTVVGKWSNRFQDFAVLRIPRQVTKEFKMVPASVSADIRSDMPLWVVGFQRPGDLVEQDFIPVKISKSKPLIKLRIDVPGTLTSQRTFEVDSDPPRKIPFDAGISGGPFLYLLNNDHIVVGLASSVPPENETGSHQYRGYGVPMSVVAETWTNIAKFCPPVKIPPPCIRDEKAARLREAYLNRLFEETARVSLRMVDPMASVQSRDKPDLLSLDTVYTALLTLSPKDQERFKRQDFRERETERFSALEQLDQHPRLVLLGDPGGGKSTFVNFVAMCLAGEILGKPQANRKLLTAPLPNDKGEDQENQQVWDQEAPLPVRVTLRDFAARGLPPAGELATADHVLQFIKEELGEILQDYALVLQDELFCEGGLVMFDGLDEVPEADRRREQIKQAVESFSATFKKCRVLVTSRTYAYQNQDWRLPSPPFSEAVLAPFSKGQIRRFVDRWYDHFAVSQGMNADEAKGNAELLKQAIFLSDRLQNLAERPLLLTLMASLHASRGRLPEKREELYADAVNLLLDWWQQRTIVKDKSGAVVLIQDSLQEFLKIGPEKVRKAVEEVAFNAHSKQTELVGTADIPAMELAYRLLESSGRNDVQVKQLMEFLSHRAGLLVSRGVDVYTFVHRTFQEYLAACHQTSHLFPNKAAELARNDPERWREVVLLTGAKAARGAPYAHVGAGAEAMPARPFRF